MKVSSGFLSRFKSDHKPTDPVGSCAKREGLCLNVNRC